MAAVQLGFDFTPAAAQPEAPKPAARAPGRPVAVLELESFLRARVPTPLRLIITDNRRTMLSLRRTQTHVHVRLHHMFLESDERVWEALVAYLFHADRSAATSIGRYIASHRTHIRRPSEQRPSGVVRRRAGRHHDLEEIFRSVNARYFDGSVDAHIVWARDASGTARRPVRRSIKLGSYNSRERRIRVHPALDAEFVPRYFVEYIVYHEMLHQVVPPTVRQGRRDLHSHAFLAREREFADYDAALRWERDNLARLLRNRKKRRTPQAGARREL